MDITPEMIDAWDTLRAAASGSYRIAPEVRMAIRALDDSDFMKPVEEAREEEEEHYAQMMAGLRGIDLNDRYPKGDENGIIHPKETS